MAQNENELIIAADGDVYAAPVGTTAPATSIAALDAGWVNLGLISEDGVTPNPTKTVDRVPSWQINTARRYVTDRDLTVAFTLQQWNDKNLPLAFGGGAVTEPTAGNYKYEAPDADDLDERALLIEWVDGTKNYRWVIPKGMVTENSETNIRKAAAMLPITFGVIETPGVAPWYILTNDPAFEA